MRGSCSTAQEIDFIHAFLQIPFDVPSFFYILNQFQCMTLSRDLFVFYNI